MGEHQIKVDCSGEYWQRYQDARSAGQVTDASGLGKTAISHAMEHGQSATEALLRSRQASVNGAGNPQLARIEELLNDHQREHQLGHVQE